MEVSLMDTLQSYFVLSMTTLCGFPSITLEGTTSDWQQLRGRAKHLAAYDLDWWIPSLLPLLDQFVLASQGQADKTFWCDFYKLIQPGSGGPYIQGHILNLFHTSVTSAPAMRSSLPISKPTRSDTASRRTGSNPGRARQYKNAGAQYGRSGRQAPLSRNPLSAGTR